ncbi:MAG: ABC transporter substrate-binding protein [Thermoprotei archaeon]|nr:MAG: ABC transporter substrate-binding protein [Thermoprotei archaeon]
MKRMLVLLIAVATILSISTPLFGQEQVTLILIGPWAGKEMEAFMPVIEEFEKMYPNINVEYRIMRTEDVAKVLPAQFEAGITFADVIFMAWPWFVAEKAKEGHLLEITDIITPEDFWPKEFVDVVTIDGKIYASPYAAWVKPGFWYRKSFFEKHGLKAPTSYEEFKELLAKLKDILGSKKAIASGDAVGWPLSDVTEHFLIYFGGKELWEDIITGRIDWTKDERVRKAFSELTELLKAEYFSDPADWTIRLTEWWEGEYGIYFMGNWIIGMVEDPGDLGLFPLPGIKGVVIGSDWVFIPKYTKHPEEAKLLVKFLASPKGQIIYCNNSGKIPTNMKVKPEEMAPFVKEQVEALKGLAALGDLDDTLGGKFQLTFWDQLKRLWVHPEELEDVLAKIQEAYVETLAAKK